MAFSSRFPEIVKKSLIDVGKLYLVKISKKSEKLCKMVGFSLINMLLKNILNERCGWGYVCKK